jgi:uncharacterized protein (TIGR00730 family)
VRVCVFCGSNRGRDPSFALVADELGRTLARAGHGVVYGGGNVGLMGIVADAALAAGGEVIGVIPAALQAKELAHHGLSELRITASMHERKALMASLADGFVALPGGFGTLDELCEIITWAQLGLHTKPVVLLDVDGFWASFAALVDATVDAGFVREEHRQLAYRAGTVAACLERLAAPPPPAPHKWIDLQET